MSFSNRFFAFASTVAILLPSILLGQANPEKYALLVGVTNYSKPELNGLKFPEKDAEALGESLKQLGFSIDVLVGNKATKKGIQEKLDQFSVKGKNEGVIFVAFCGHGTEFADTKRSYFCPYDAAMKTVRDAEGNALYDSKGNPMMGFVPESLVAIDDVLLAFGESMAAHRVLVADCCRDDPNRARGRSFGSSLTTDRLPLQTLLLLGCSPQQRSIEHDDWGHGALSKCLIDQLAEAHSKPNRTMGSIAEDIIPAVEALVASGTNKLEKQKPRILMTGRVELLTSESDLNRESKIFKALQNTKLFPTVLPGSKAPDFGDLPFARGKPFREFKQGSVYVINTFATWCPPCVSAIPGLAKLQKKYPKVTVVDVCLEPMKDVETFLKERIEKIEEGIGSSYAFAVVGDWEGTEFSKNWMETSSSNAIPTCFVVDQKGKIAWIGHPDQDKPTLEEILEKVVDGEWDSARTRNAYLVKREAELVQPVMDAWEHREIGKDVLIDFLNQVGNIEDSQTQLASWLYQYSTVEGLDKIRKDLPEPAIQSVVKTILSFQQRELHKGQLDPNLLLILKAQSHFLEGKAAQSASILGNVLSNLEVASDKETEEAKKFREDMVEALKYLRDDMLGKAPK